MLREIDGFLAAANMRVVRVCSELVRNMDAAGAAGFRADFAAARPFLNATGSTFLELFPPCLP